MEKIDSSLTDEKLIEAARGGQLKAFDQLVERHFGLVYLVAYGRMKSREAAEDLAQEVFLRAFLNLDKFKAPYNFPAWVGSITRNLSINWLKRDQRVSRLTAMVAMDPVNNEDAHFERKNVRKTMENQERDSAIREAVFQLPEKQRDMVLMRYVENLNDREIAKRLDVHSSTVGRQISKALSSMRSPLEELLQDWGASERPQAKAVARTTAMIAAAAALAPSSKAALVAAATGKAVAIGAGKATGLGIGSAVVSAKFVSAPFMATLAALWSVLSAKFTLVASVCLIGLLGLVSHNFIANQSIATFMGSSATIPEQELRAIHQQFQAYQHKCASRDLVGALTAWDVTTAGVFGGTTTGAIHDGLKTMFRSYSPELNVIANVRFESMNLLITPLVGGQFVVLKASNPYWIVRCIFYRNSMEWKIVQLQFDRRRPMISPPPSDMMMIGEVYKSYRAACGQYDAELMLRHWEPRRMPGSRRMSSDQISVAMKEVVRQMAHRGGLKRVAGQDDYSVLIMPGQKDLIELRSGNYIWHYLRTAQGWRIVYQEEYLMVNDSALAASQGLSGVALLN